MRIFSLEKTESANVANACRNAIESADGDYGIPPMVDEAQIEKAFDWLQKNEVAAAEARAQRVWAEQYRKSLKAILMNESDSKTAAAQEADAYADRRYLEHLEVLKAAVMDDELYRARIGRLHLLTDYWRSVESSRRAMGAVAR